MPHFNGLRYLFGVDHTATPSELKKAYYKVSQKYHPDLNPSEDAKVKMQKITNAYEILSDSKKMQEYKKERGEKVRAVQKSAAAKKKKAKSRKNKKR
ncbi:DnaJ domain-containing protein [Candidatus Peregrinibacteria bacterium]|jgi:DnaJ-class molecular chaperone|nr:DnaJ domain-containing protein [Candidatus Peregrinibacteria bacterium]